MCHRRRRSDTRPGRTPSQPLPGRVRPLDLPPRPGRHWAERRGRHKGPHTRPRPCRRATYTRPHGVRHLFTAFDLTRDKLYGHIKPTRPAPGSWRSAVTCAACTHRPPASRSCWTTSPRTCPPAVTPGGTGLRPTTSRSTTPHRQLLTPNWIEAQCTALRHFALDGTDPRQPQRTGQHPGVGGLGDAWATARSGRACEQYVSLRVSHDEGLHRVLLPLARDIPFWSGGPCHGPAGPDRSGINDRCPCTGAEVLDDIVHRRSRTSGFTVQPRSADSGLTLRIAQVAVGPVDTKPAGQHIVRGSMAEVHQRGQQPADHGRLAPSIRPRERWRGRAGRRLAQPIAARSAPSWANSSAGSPVICEHPTITRREAFLTRPESRDRRPAGHRA